MINRTIFFLTTSTIVSAGGKYYVNRSLGRYIEEISKSFQDCVYVGSLAPKTSRFYTADQKSMYAFELKKENIRFHFLKLADQHSSFLPRAWKMFQNMRSLKNVIQESDFVYAFLPSLTNLRVLSYIQGRIPFAVYLASDWETTFVYRSKRNLPFINSFIKKRYLELEKKILPHAQFILTAGESLYQKYQASHQKVQKTYPLLSLDPSLRKPKEKIFDRKKDFLYVGNLEERKGVLDLIQAMKELHQKGHCFTLRLIGAAEKTFEEKVVRQIKENGLEGSIEILGYISDPQKLQRYYEMSDVFLLPTKGEGFPRVIYEALSYQLPIVANEIPEIKAAASQHGFCQWVKANDPEDFARGIEAVLKKEQQEHLLEEGRKFLETCQFRSPAKQVVDQLGEVLSKCAG